MHKCDRCNKKHKVKKQTIMCQKTYIRPFSCSGGDYWVTDFYFFNCLCGRRIEVDEEKVKDRWDKEELYTDYSSGRCIQNLKKYKQ